MKSLFLYCRLVVSPQLHCVKFKGTIEMQFCYRSHIESSWDLSENGPLHIFSNTEVWKAGVYDDVITKRILFPEQE